MTINFLGLPQHYANTAKLRTAEDTELISEPEYKTMSGYDASQNVWGLGDLMGPVKPYSNVAASTLYNVDKSIRNPGDYFDETGNPKVGPMESIDLNVKGALEGLTPELKEKYEGILGLDLRSLTDTWAPDDLTDFSGVYNDKDEYDFSGIKGQTAGLGVASFLAEKFGPKLGAYLFKTGKNKALKEIGKKVKPILSGVLTGGQAQGAGDGGGGYQDQGGYSTQGGFTGKADSASGGVRGHHGDFAQGGRVSYFDGGLASLWLR